MSVLITLTTFFLLFGSAIAQINATQCSSIFSSAYTWAYNSLNQNPCEVAAYLQSTCHGGSFSMTPLLSGQEYVGPSLNESSDLCACNTVTYSLVSGCGACQSATWIDWPLWATNCTTVLAPGTFPNPVPDGTRVPQWAVADVTRYDLALWDLTKAEAIGDTPEIGPGELINGSNSTTGPGTTRTPSPNPTGLPVATPSSLSPSPSSTSGKSRSNTGAIVGGIVGGIAIIAAAVLGSVYLFRRRTKGPTVVNDASYLHEGSIGKLSNEKESSPRHEVPPPPVREPHTQVPNYPLTFHGPEVGSHGAAIPPQAVFNPYQGAPNSLPMQVSQTQGYNGYPIIH